jgi:hypothetical protein
MLIHHYDPITGSYINSSIADESPLEPGVILLPAHATIIEPPEAREGFYRRFVFGIWGYTPIDGPIEEEPTPEPIPIDPLSIPLERLDFWLVAAQAGVSKWSVRDRIAAMPEGVEKNAAIAYFEDAQVYRRDDPLLNAMALAEGITGEQLDTLWTWAVNS